MEDIKDKNPKFIQLGSSDRAVIHIDIYFNNSNDVVASYIVVKRRFFLFNVKKFITLSKTSIKDFIVRKRMFPLQEKTTQMQYFNSFRPMICI